MKLLKIKISIIITIYIVVENGDAEGQMTVGIPRWRRRCLRVLANENR